MLNQLPSLKKSRPGNDRTSIGTAMANLLLFNEIIRVTGMLEKNKIDYIVLKGPRLIRLYKDLGVRKTADIDILVKKKDTGKVEEILYSIGYADYSRYHSKLHQTLLGYHYQYMSKDLMIEVHFDLFPPLAPIVRSGLDPWRHTCTIKIFNSRIQTLQDDFLFLYLGTNFIFPNFFCDSMKFFNDMKLLSKKMDWKKIYAMAEESKSFFYIYYTCYYARRLAGANIPAQFLRTLEKKLSAAELLMVRIFDERYLLKKRSNPYIRKVFLYIVLNLAWRIRV